MDTPSGHTTFLAALGITAKALACAKRAGTHTVVNEVTMRYVGLPMTDPDRSELPLPQDTDGLRGLLSRMR